MPRAFKENSLRFNVLETGALSGAETGISRGALTFKVSEVGLGLSHQGAVKRWRLLGPIWVPWAAVENSVASQFEFAAKILA